MRENHRWAAGGTRCIKCGLMKRNRRALGREYSKDGKAWSPGALPSCPGKWTYNDEGERPKSYE